MRNYCLSFLYHLLPGFLNSYTCLPKIIRQKGFVFFIFCYITVSLRVNYSFFCRYCDIFPSINIKGTVKHLQLMPHELEDYEKQAERVLKRYLKRLNWLLSGRYFCMVILVRAMLWRKRGIIHLQIVLTEVRVCCLHRLTSRNISFDIFSTCQRISELHDTVSCFTEYFML